MGEYKMGFQKVPSASRRLRQFKNRGKEDLEELRKQRGEVNVQLRKKSRDEDLAKRRNINLSDDEGGKVPAEEREQIFQMTIQELERGLQIDQLKYTRAARVLTCKQEAPPIDDMIRIGILPLLTNFLQRHQDPNLQYEAAWTLTNIASGTADHTKEVVKSGAVPHLIALMSHSDPKICVQVTWALANIAGDGVELRDYVINQGIVQPLLALIHKSENSKHLGDFTWTLSNLCRNYNKPPAAELGRFILPTLYQWTQTGHRGLIYRKDVDVVRYSCLAIAYLTHTRSENIQLVVDSGVVTRLVELLDWKDTRVLAHAMRSIGNIATGTNVQTEIILRQGVLSKMDRLLRHPKKSLVKEACWIMSNIMAGTERQKQRVIDTGLLASLTEVLTHGDLKAKKEVAWAFTNLVDDGSIQQIEALYTAGALKPMCDLLSAKDSDLILVLLDGIKNVLEV